MLRKRIALLLIPLLLSLPFEVGCNSSQVSAAVNAVSLQVPSLMQLAADIANSAGNSEVAAVFGNVAQIAAADLPSVQAAIAAYQSSPASSSFQKIVDALDPIVNAVNTQLLAANRITNSQSQQTALLSLQLFATGLNVADGYLIAVQSKKAQQDHSAAHQVKISQIAPLLRNSAQQLASGIQLSPRQFDAAVRYETALGF